jgi:hypothetical protein
MQGNSEEVIWSLEQRRLRFTVLIFAKAVGEDIRRCFEQRFTLL